MNSALADIGMTITQPLFSLALILIATRFLAQLCGVSGYNPISVAVRRITDPVVKPFSTLIPSGNRFNAGGLLALILCQVLFIAIMLSLIGRFEAFNILQALIWSALGCDWTPCQYYFLQCVGNHHCQLSRTTKRTPRC
jgi:YggT family protein